MTIVWIAISIVALIGLWIACLLLLNFISEHGHLQQKFLSGKLPDPSPDGFYAGRAILLGGVPVPWLGKSFVRTEDLGYNIFTPGGATLLRLATPFYKPFNRNADGNTDAYFFRTSTGRGFKDYGIQTFKLDYDSRDNPFIIRIILDEIVETAPNEYLGKVHLKVFPGYYATIGYFGLKKTS